MFRFILLVSLFLFSLPSFALGKLGHQLVCQIAFDHLSKDKQQHINQLLLNMPSTTKALINHYLYQDKKAPITFAKTCIWADAIKKNKQFDKFKPWHYINVSRSTKHITDDSCRSNCVTQAIKIDQALLKTTQNPWKKTQALMFLGHWLGDIHQPLHVSYASDWGGNKIKINSPDKKCTNLHWLWDTCLLSREHLNKQQWLVKLNKQWQQVPIKQWQQTSISQWADESLQLVRKANLGYCHVNSQGVCKMSTKEQSAHLYSPAYQAHYSALLQQRLLQAAARLNKLLEQAL